MYWNLRPCSVQPCFILCNVDVVYTAYNVNILNSYIHIHIYEIGAYAHQHTCVAKDNVAACQWFSSSLLAGRATPM